jgi:hypothetical protein
VTIRDSSPDFEFVADARPSELGGRDDPHVVDPHAMAAHANAGVWNAA